MVFGPKLKWIKTNENLMSKKLIFNFFLSLVFSSIIYFFWGKTTLLNSIIFLLGLFLQGCAGAPIGWGGVYEVIQSNSKSITLKYDTVLGKNKIFDVATEHCKKFDKEPVPTEKSSQMLGVALQTFECR